MNVSDFKTQAGTRIKTISDLLNQLYGIQIDWDAPVAHLESVLAHYEERKTAVLQEGIAVMAHPEYTKSMLIAEAIRLYLREIAPARKKKSRRPQ